MILTMLGGEFDAGTIGKYKRETIVFEKNITEIDSLQFSFS